MGREDGERNGESCLTTRIAELVVGRNKELSRTMYVTYISDVPTISDPRAPASHPHAGRLGLVVTSCKERLVGDDVARCSRRAILFIHSRFSSFASRRT